VKIKPYGFILAGIFLALELQAAEGGKVKQVHGDYSREVSQLSPTGLVPATNQLRLAISLPLRDRQGLANFVAQVSDPGSPTYRKYLTPGEITARYGPTEQDYEAVKDFARSNNLSITTTFGNRLVLDVIAPAATVEKAFNVTLRTYRHPTEPRNFFAPDTAPTVDAALPVAEVSGLSDYWRPHSRRPKQHMPRGAPRNGSSPDGNGAVFGDDFRRAYAPGTTLTGAGQTVGLFEWDGSYSNAVEAYAAMAGGGRTNIVIQYVLLDGFNGVATLGYSSGEPEVDMDIEMAMAMAPGLSKIVVFEGNPESDSVISVLDSMATNSEIKNLSCSWGWTQALASYTNTDTIFLEMAAQGQSFFSASGDGEAFTVGSNSANGVDTAALYNLPSSTPYITQSGGTVLTMNGTGASYGSETVWNSGYNYYEGASFGSSGGVSSYYSIPAWQTNTSMTNNGGSTMNRNIPDVAADALNIYEVTGEDASGYVSGPQSIMADDFGGGTSSAAPLWAGFIALVNQQAAANGLPSAGFINPAIYEIGNSTNYNACFYDTTTGNNEWPSSPSQYLAAPGYDLCTGWGTPKTGLINALTMPLAVDLIQPQTVGTEFQFQFLSRPGFSHDVQWRTNLVSGSWQLYTNVTGDGTVKTISLPLSVFSPSQQGYVDVVTH
jgi:subtilase family serine protease